MLMASSLRQLGVAVRVLLVFTVILGVLYPLSMTGIAQVLFPGNANGSIIKVDGKAVASDLIGQGYTLDSGTKDADGKPVMVADPKWFQTRPSAVDYDGMGSAASQYGPNNPELVKLIDERRQEVAKLNGVDPSQVPPDAVTASGSGLDAGISPAYAAIQVNRVARERGMTVAAVQQLVKENTTGRTLGFLGEPYVNVVTLNAALAKS
ncbi:K(+)-transporting ATPase subunit C [Kribbella solani]|uniref:K(+)-transporting ATPase subunit C n=1 Tax=Kribbella solani TaxID=236067 RepID=UPI0029A74E3C|nr:K(+)-transporting ATPase subunit C [Kribbella solani]MDX2968510.1 K(+)-transporting ATPase subunit C [Kribbella solani]MDX3003869.1 K(+)-transporting ATPase subunit C [Kribbella solani]